jgi:hypothetical protein
MKPFSPHIVDHVFAITQYFMPVSTSTPYPQIVIAWLISLFGGLH